MSVLDRFLRYARIDTQADETSATCPSTPGQLELQRLLAAELREIGLSDVTLDDHGYLMATIPATVTHDAPIVGFIAHVDTSPTGRGSPSWGGWLPTPNLFAGEHNFHSRLEWTSRQDLERAAAVIVEVARIWADGVEKGKESKRLLPI